MTFQWELAAGMMYVEVLIVAIFCIPFISNTRWQKFFRLRLLQQLAATCKIAFFCAVMFQTVLFIDSTSSSLKLQEQMAHRDLSSQQSTVHEALTRMFRSQRNMYISGFALFLLLVIWRLKTLISSHAMCEMSLEAFKRQAQNASTTAEQFMAECERLKLQSAMSAAEANKGKEGVEKTEPVPKVDDDQDIPAAGEPERFGDLATAKEQLKHRISAADSKSDSAECDQKVEEESESNKKDD